MKIEIRIDPDCTEPRAIILTAAVTREAEELRLTREVIAHFDAAIRETPGQWFWYNKRWVLDPPQG